MTNSRRVFLKNALKVGTATTVAGLAFSGCSGDKSRSGSVIRGKSKKEEILYQKSQHWSAYYKAVL